MNTNDTRKKLFHQLLPNLSKNNNFPDSEKTLLLGFACDEGVRRNNGRPGAFGGPEAFKEQWEHRPGDEDKIADGGIFTINSQALSLFQRSFGAVVSKGLDQYRRVLAIGGGHEITWAMHLGMLGATCNSEKPVIGHLNFDAHFDLRPYYMGANSGTSFRQISDERKFANQPYHYLCLGLDSKSTPDFLFDAAHHLGVKFHLNEAVLQWSTADWIECIEAFAEPLDRLYVTVDMDVFHADAAPGVSAVAKNGLQPDALLPVFEFLSTFDKVQCLDIAELNPIFDRDDRTARLAVRVARALAGL